MEVTKFISKDGKTRVVISQDEYADNPRHMTDEPLHCEDWSRDYSIMNTQERANCNRSSSAKSLLVCLIREYGDHKKVLDVLFENGKHMYDGKAVSSDALSFNKSTKKWEHMCYEVHYNYETKKNEKSWYAYNSFCCKKHEIDVYDVVDSIDDDSAEYLAANCMTDKVKMMSYSFGYNGEVTFHDGFDTSSEGIAWLEKDEFLKYSGCDEERWKNNTLREIEYLIGELEAWSNNEVYTISVEHAVRVKSTREYPDGEHETEVREYIKWEDDDCCGGFYGEYDKMLPFMFEQFGLKQEDFEEVKE